MALRRDDPLVQRALESMRLPENKPAAPVAAPRTVDDVTQEELDERWRRRNLELTSETGRAFNMGVAGVRSGLVATRGLARNLFGPEGSGDADLQRSVDISKQAAAEGPRIQQVKQIGGVGDALEYGRNMVVQQVPNLALMLGTGGVAGAARAGLGGLARRQAVRSAAENIAARRAGGEAVEQAALRKTRDTIARRLPAARPAGETAQRLGAAAGGTTLQAGQMAEAALDDTQGGTAQERAAKAAAGALATGAFEALPVAALLRRYGLAPAEKAAQSAFSGPLASRVAKAAAAQGLTEAGTEVAQTVGELATHKWINSNTNLLDDDALNAYINAAVGGAVGGAAFGAPAGIRSANASDPKVRERLRKGWDSLQSKLRPSGAAVSETAETQGPRFREGADVSRAGVARRAEIGAEGLAARATGDGTTAGPIRQAENAVKEGYDKTVDFLRQNMAFNSVMAGIDGKPYDFTMVDGEAVISGAPLKDFIDGPRSLQYATNLGLGRMQARFASPIQDEATVARLAETGALDAAHKAFTGWDTGKFSDQEKAALNEYIQALPADKSNDFQRTIMTWEAVDQAGGMERNEDGSLGDAYIYQPESAGPLARSSESEDTQQRAAEQAERQAAGIFEASEAIKQNVFKAARGVRATARTTGVVMAQQDGTDPRVVNLGGAIRELREDPAFVQSIQELPANRRLEAEVTSVLSSLVEQGYAVDPETISSGVALDASGGWKLTPAAAMRIRAGLGDERAIEVMRQRGERTPLQPRQTAVGDPGGPRAEIDPGDARGQADRMETVDEVPPDPNNQPFIERTPMLPGQGSPGTSTAADTRTIDSGTVDRETLRQERITERDQSDTRARPTGISVADRPRRIASRQNREGARPDIARRNVDVATAGAVARQQQIQDDAERGGSTSRTQEGRERQEAVGREVGEAISLTFTNSTAAKNLREYMRAGNAGSRNAVNFVSAISKLMSSRAGIERLVQELPKIRSRVALVELMDAVEQSYAATGSEQFYERANIALHKRLGQLTEEISRAGDNQAARGGVERAILPQQYEEQNKRLNEAAGDPSWLTEDVVPPPFTDVLEKLLPHFNPQQRAVIEGLLATGALAGVDFSYGYADGRFTAGVYYAAVDQVALTLPASYNLTARNVTTNDLFSVIVHEAVHAATMKAEAKNAPLRKDLNALLNHVRDSLEAQGIDVDQWYGLSETQEFLAEAFSNPLLQELLESVPALNTNTFKNAWEEFKGWIKQLLGLTNQQATALEEVLTIGREMMREQGMIRAGARGRLWENGSQGGLNSAHRSDPADLLKFISPEDRARLISTFEAKDMREQIRKFMPKREQGLLDTADLGPETALNWGVGLALANKIKLTGKARPALQQLWDVISKFLQIPSRNVYSEQIIKDLKKGKVAKGYRADARVLGPRALQATRWLNKKVVPVADALLKNMNTRLRETGIPAMRELATLMAQRTGEFRADRSNSLRQNWEQSRGQFMNRLDKIIGGIDDETANKLITALQSRKRPRGPVGKLYDSVRQYLDDMYDYAQEAGYSFGKKGEYFPVAIDRDALVQNREEYFELHREFEPQVRERFERWTQDKINALPKDPKNMSKAEKKELRRLHNVLDGIAKRPIDELIGELYDMAQFGARTHYLPGVDFTNPGHKPAFKHGNHMTSDFIFEHGSPDQVARFAAFQTKDIKGVLAGYTNRMTRRAEWERLNLTDRINGLIEKARGQGATARDIAMMQDFVNMEMGTYNDDWNPVVKRIMVGIDRMFDTTLADTDFQKAKGVMGALQTYNNIRLLPLAVLSSLVDPIATMVRSGTPAGAFSNLRDGLRALRNKEGNDQLRAMAEEMGIVEREGLSDLMASLYGNVYDPNSRSARVNSWLFRMNGMESMLRYTRLTALAAGHRFLIKHKTRPNEQSERYLKELGLTPSMIRVTKNGQFVVMSPEIEAALRRFVDESTVRPYPGQKPSWHNDPNFSLAAQYKGYLYAFYETVLKRTALELGNNNPAVLAPLLMYLPITMMAEMARDMLQDDGEDKDAEDYMVQSLDRSGLLGARFGMITDTQKNVQYGSGVAGTLAGATGQQIGDAYDVVTGDASFGGFVEEALPGQALYKNWGDE